MKSFVGYEGFESWSRFQEMSNTRVKKRLWLSPIVVVMFHFCSSWIQLVDGACTPSNGCSTALAYYVTAQGDTLDGVASRFGTNSSAVTPYNNIPNPSSLATGQTILFPFSCDCLDGSLGHQFSYDLTFDDSFTSISNTLFEGLTNPWALSQVNGDGELIPGQYIKVPVNCSCGNPEVSTLYGLFVTYAAQPNDTASSLSGTFGIQETYLEEYNPSANWDGSLSDAEILFIPVRENSTGLYPPYNSSSEGSSNNNSAVIGASVGGGIGLLLFIVGLCLFYVFCWRKTDPAKGSVHSLQVPRSSHGSGGFSGERMLASSSAASAASAPAVSALSDFTVDKSVEFSYEELAAATNNFNVANKIGEGGYGSVYLATLRGQKMAVKRMNLQATREFLAELQVLTRVHHTNLVQLIGYCTVESLFLIYEYVNNGTLDRHLHSRDNLPPLSWEARVQIALDAARGLEYIHEHTKPTYIHRDVKSSNILIDMQLHAKVADFGLTKLTESVSGSYPTRLVGTFGYMSPEYARFGDVSPKIDVYAFGVVLFEILSAKEAIVRIGPTNSDLAGNQRGLVTMFEEVLTDREDALRSLMDPALGGDYPIDIVWKMAKLAGSCTQENPELRPSMRTVVVALMSLSSTTEEWDMSAFTSDPVMLSMSGR